MKKKKRILQEYRCENCDMLLCKGYIIDEGSYIEIWCRRCDNIQEFYGKEATYIKKRQKLLHMGAIADSMPD